MGVGVGEGIGVTVGIVVGAGLGMRVAGSGSAGAHDTTSKQMPNTVRQSTQTRSRKWRNRAFIMHVILAQSLQMTKRQVTSVFDCQRSCELTQVALFSVNKWPSFRLTKTDVFEIVASKY